MQMNEIIWATIVELNYFLFFAGDRLNTTKGTPADPWFFQLEPIWENIELWLVCNPKCEKMCQSVK